MTFVFPFLLGGLALAAIPVALHFIARDKPKTLPFPAFRFLVQTRKATQRKMQLRHLLLLLLRMAIIAGLCLALARPRVLNQGLNLASETPVDLELLIDVSDSMDYQSSDGKNRLDEAKRLALELLDELPEGSRVRVNDTADTFAAEAGANDGWVSPAAARQTIASLRIRSTSRTVSSCLGDLPARQGKTRPADEANADGATRRQALTAVFSDRTRGSWRADEAARAQEKWDQLPARPIGLTALRGKLASLTAAVRAESSSLDEKLGTSNQAGLLDAIAGLEERLASFSVETFATDPGLKASVSNFRKLARDERNRLTSLAREKEGKSVGTTKSTLIDRLDEALRLTAGGNLLYFDVGVPDAVDLAIVGMRLRRAGADPDDAWFSAGDRVALQVVVSATGKAHQQTLTIQAGKHKSLTPLDLQPGQTQVVPWEFETAEMPAGFYEIDAKIGASSDLLPFKDRRTLTFALREPTQAIVIADGKDRASDIARGLSVLPGGYAVTMQRPGEATFPASAKIVFLAGLTKPSDELWKKAEAFVKAGGGLAVFPPGDGADMSAYATKQAQSVLAGLWLEKIGPADPPAGWRLEATSARQHPFSTQFFAWSRDDRIDFARHPRGATLYYRLDLGNDAQTVVSYADAERRPAVAERSLGGGIVMQFTTPMTPEKIAWNNYRDSLTTMYLAILDQTARRLVGPAASRPLNFTLGQATPKFPVPAGVEQITLRSADRLEPIKLPADTTEYSWRGADQRGAFEIDGPTPKSPILGQFSVELPGEESDLAKIADEELRPLFGGAGVYNTERRASLRAITRGLWEEPFELFPYFMIGLLLFLAIETLLANRFYGKERA